MSKIFNKSFVLGALAVVLLGAGTMTYAAQDRVSFEDLTEEQQEIVEQVKELKEAGDKEGAKALAAEYDLPKMKRGGEHSEKHQAVRAAVEAGDYNAFTEAVGDSDKFGEINASDFAQLVEAHELKEAGDKEGAKAIMEELEIKPHRHGGIDKENLTDAQLETLKEAKELKEAGDKEGAKALIEEAGIEFKKKGHRGGGQGGPQARN